MFGWWREFVAEFRRQLALREQERLEKQRLIKVTPQFGVSVEVRRGEDAPLPDYKKGDWDEIPSAEKIKRVPLKPLPFKDGEVVASKSKSTKRFVVRVTPQAPGIFELDGEKAVTVSVVARGRKAAMDVIAEHICGRDAWSETDENISGTCGRWYDGDYAQLEVLSIETA